MKTTVILTLVIFLSACTSRQELATQSTLKCPDAGIDINSPDFYKPVNAKSMEAFYACMLEETAVKQELPFLVKRTVFALLSDNDSRKQLTPRLEFQKNLWRQILAREKSPGEAQEAWIVWSNFQSTNEQEVAAAEAAASAARRASSNMQYHQQQLQMQQFQQQSAQQRQWIQQQDRMGY